MPDGPGHQEHLGGAQPAEPDHGGTAAGPPRVPQPRAHLAALPLRRPDDHGQLWPDREPGVCGLLRHPLQRHRLRHADAVHRPQPRRQALDRVRQGVRLPSFAGDAVGSTAVCWRCGGLHRRLLEMRRAPPPFGGDAVGSTAVCWRCGRPLPRGRCGLASGWSPRSVRASGLPRYPDGYTAEAPAGPVRTAGSRRMAVEMRWAPPPFGGDAVGSTAAPEARRLSRGNAAGLCRGAGAGWHLDGARGPSAPADFRGIRMGIRRKPRLSRCGPPAPGLGDGRADRCSTPGACLARGGLEMPSASHFTWFSQTRPRPRFRPRFLHSV